jgi:hypothetical protein
VVDLPAVCWGLIPMPSSVMIAEVAGGTLNSSAANLRTAVNGVFSGTLNLKRFEIIMIKISNIFSNKSYNVKTTCNVNFIAKGKKEKQD